MWGQAGYNAGDMRELRRIGVYCGSNFGAGDAFRAAAAGLGTELARRHIGLVYGGTDKGLMGVLADAVLAAGGTAHGVITQRLADKGQLHARLTTHEIAPDMRSRKARMIELADALVALPGGIGTTEEFMEAWTLNQLGDIDKPVGLLDVEGYYRTFLAFIDTMVTQGFLPGAHRDSIVVRDAPAALIDGLAAYQPVTVSKWMS
jgi:uncharacterized protein (TIGR00730 family)